MFLTTIYFINAIQTIGISLFFLFGVQNTQIIPTHTTLFLIALLFLHMICKSLQNTPFYLLLSSYKKLIDKPILAIIFSIPPKDLK